MHLAMFMLLAMEGPCKYSKNLQGPSMAKSINMVRRPHIARVKTKNILNIRIGLFKAPLSYVD